MKKLLCFLLALPFTALPQTTHKKVTALFIGNSFTYVNNLPLLIANMALANGDTLVYDGNTIGGYSLNNHFNDATSLSKINAQHWQYTILQAQSQEPSFPPSQVNAQTLPYAIKLDSAVKHNYSCTNTVFYETWGKKNGDAANCASYPPICTYTGSQNRLEQSYKLFADTTQSIMSPAGEAFRKSIAADPTLELYMADESHPALTGSYLAAAVFYEVLFQKSVLTNTYNPGIAANTLGFLQQTAHTTVNDSLLKWNLGKYLPWADFSISQANYPLSQFHSLSTGLSENWYFGDGASDQSPNPTHTYAPGTYTISHVVANGCKKDSVAKVVVIIPPNGLNEYADASTQLTVMPNPCSSVLSIQNAERFKNTNTSIEIRNTLGEVMQQGAFSAAINTSGLQNGIYFLSIYNGKHTYNTRFIKSN